MKMLKSRSGRKIMLYDNNVHRDYGRKYQKELIDSYDLAKDESFFRIFAKIMIGMVIFFGLFVGIRQIF